MFFQLLLLGESLRRHSPELVLHVCYFGLTPAQGAYVRWRFVLLDKPTDIEAPSLRLQGPSRPLRRRHRLRGGGLRRIPPCCCPFRPFSNGVFEDRWAKSPARQCFPPVAPRDKRSKTDRKRRENGGVAGCCRAHPSTVWPKHRRRLPRTSVNSR